MFNKFFNRENQEPRKGQRFRYEVHIPLALICFILALPAIYVLLVATMDITEAFTATPADLIPPGSDFVDNVQSLFTNRHFDRVIWNTLVISVVVVIGKTVFSILAGLAFVYFRFPGKIFLFFAVLLTLLMPTEIILLPLFNLVADLGWGGEHPRLALTMPFLASAIGAFLFRQHFSNFPTELVDAARIDGASPLHFLVWILLPMSWNIIGAIAVVQFIYMWNQYLWPKLILGLDQNKYQVMQVAVRQTVSGMQSDFGSLMAAGIVASIPPLIVFLLLQKQFMSGFAITRDK